MKKSCDYFLAFFATFNMNSTDISNSVSSGDSFLSRVL